MKELIQILTIYSFSIGIEVIELGFEPSDFLEESGFRI